MQRFGAFQTGQRLHCGAAASVYLCEDGAGNRKALKTLDTPPGLEPSTSFHAAGCMLESAWVQRDAASLGLETWAPIHDFGQQDHTAYLVSDRFDGSLADLIGPGIRNDPSALRQIFLSITDGLLEAETQLGRGHGNLKPGNVLIDWADDDSGLPTRVCLCDPAPATQFGRRQAALKDRKDLGRLIVAVVTGIPMSEADTWPVPNDPAWAKLGIVGQAWHDLAGDLLRPVAEEGPLSWDEVRRRIDLLVPPVVKPKRWPWAAAAAVVLLAVGLVGFFNYPRDMTTPATLDELVELAREYNNWAGTAQTQLTDTSSNNAQLAAYVDSIPELAEAFDGRLRGETSLTLGPSKLLNKDARFYLDLLQDMQRVKDKQDEKAQLALDEVAAFLESDKPAAVRAKQALEAVVKTRELLKTYIDKREKATADQPGQPDTAKRIMSQHAEYARKGFTNERLHIIPAIKRLNQAGNAINEIRSTIELAGKVKLGDEDDPFVKAVVSKIKTGLSNLSATDPDQEPDTDGLLTLSKLSRTTRQLIANLANDRYLHYPSFKKLHAELYTVANEGVDDELLEKWQLAVKTPGDAHVPTNTDGKPLDDPRQGWAAIKRITSLKGMTNKLDEYEDPENAVLFRNELSTVQVIIDGAWKKDGQELPWTRGSRSEIEKRIGAADKQLTAIGGRLANAVDEATLDWGEEVKRLEKVDLKEMVKPDEAVERYFAPLAGYRFSNSSALREGWKAALNQAVTSTQPKKRAVALKKAVHAGLRDLRAIDEGLPAGHFASILKDTNSLEGWDRETTAGRYTEKREQAIRELINQGVKLLAAEVSSGIQPGPTPQLLTRSITSKQTSLDQWARGVRGVVEGYRAAFKSMAGLYLPGEQLQAQDNGGHKALSDQIKAGQATAGKLGMTADFVDADAQYSLYDRLSRPDGLNQTEWTSVKQALGTNSGVTSSQALATAATDAKQKPEVRALAAIGLLKLHKSADAKALERVLGFSKLYRTLLTNQLGNDQPKRMKLLTERYKRQASLAWQRSADAASNAQQLTAVTELYPQATGADPQAGFDPDSAAVGIEPNRLKPATRINLHLAQSAAALKAIRDKYKAIKNRDPKSYDAKKEDGEVEILATAMRSKLAKHLNNNGKIKAIDEALADAIKKHRLGGQKVASTNIGPMSPWLERELKLKVTLIEGRPEELTEVRRYRVEYTVNGNAMKQDLAFRLVKPKDGAGGVPAYLSTSEVPAKFLIDLLAATGKSDEFMSEDVAYIAGQRVSPVWEVTGGKLSMRNWTTEALKFDRKLPWINVRASVTRFKRRAEASGVNEPITGNHPMQCINGRAAYYFARLLGCRLPTRQEWQAAYEAYRTTDQYKKNTNIRDLTWYKQQNQLIEVNKAGIEDRKLWTSDGTFTERSNLFDQDAKVMAGDKATRDYSFSSQYNDGYVWPRAVKPEDPAFQDLVGNCAEWVVTDTGESATDGLIKLPEKGPTRDEARQFFNARWKAKQIGVIGQSAISCSQHCKPGDLVILDKHVPALPAVKYVGFADVGFRLAFTAGQPRLTFVVESLLRQTPFVKPQNK